MFVVAYDISDRTRDRVAQICLDYGSRIQYSVFQCDIQPDRANDLVRRALKHLDPADDRMHVFQLCGTCSDRTRVLGRINEPSPVRPEGAWVI